MLIVGLTAAGWLAAVVSWPCMASMGEIPVIHVSYQFLFGQNNSFLAIAHRYDFNDVPLRM